jgi:putative phosphoribosyl transferase
MIPEMIFEDRLDAGRKLGDRLVQYLNTPVVVLAIPNGGVPVGIEVVKSLNKAEFDVIISRKIPIPQSPDTGFGAIANNGSMILNKEIVPKTGLNLPQIRSEADKVRQEIKKRKSLYFNNRCSTRVLNKTVIIVDDGLASGITMKAAIESLRKRHPKEIIVAVPTACNIAINMLKGAVDQIITCVTGSTPYGVADYYRHWYDVPDEEVISYLEKWCSRYQKGISEQKTSL